MSLEIKKVKSYHLIDIKYKTKYRRFIALSNSFTAQTNFIAFKGAEIDKEVEINNIEDVKKIFENTENIERYYPWTSIVEIQVKRYIEE